MHNSSMIDNKTYDSINSITGDESKTQQIMKVMDTRLKVRPLTEMQQRVYDYLLSGKPVITQRQVSEATGLDHPQKLVAILASLTMRGWLVPKDKVDNKTSV